MFVGERFYSSEPQELSSLDLLSTAFITSMPDIFDGTRKAHCLQCTWRSLTKGNQGKSAWPSVHTWFSAGWFGGRVFNLVLSRSARNNFVIL